MTGVVAGAVNAVAGGGSLISFPALVATGLSPLTANITNTIAQLPGYVSIVEGYRPDLKGQGPRIRKLLVPTVIGAGVGVVLLHLGGEDAFEAVVPWLVLGACVLLGLGPRLRTKLAAREGHEARISPGLWIAVLGCGAYASYFGAAAGVLLLAVLALGIIDALQRLNALNRVMVLAANLAAAPALIILGPIDWPSVAALAPATLVGGAIGARVARRLDDGVLRAAVIVLGVGVAIWMLLR
ncbi:MAG: sulfite exporter TauE/SafE family protein [Thermoleophilia bacterium]